MKKKIFLTSAIAMGFVAPAFAAMTDSNTFPDGGLMQANTRYIGAATADNMDTVYEGSVNATAEYETLNYLLSAGMYLPADSETPTTCPAGSFCSGIGSVNYNENSAQGIASCPTAYSLSAAGATSADECYRTCTASDVAHSKSTGTFTGMFYSNNTNACEPVNNESCANGYHYKAGLNVEDTIGDTEGENSACISASGSFGEKNWDGRGAKGQTYYSLTDNNTWAVDYGDKGFLYGQARCSTVQGVFDFDWSGNKLNQPITTHTTSELGSEGGQYCYCNVTGYTPDGGTLQSLSSSWVFASGSSSGAASCASYCAENCAGYVRYASSAYLAWRAALLGAVQSTPAMCEANTITINWSNASDTDIATNNAGTATYGSDVRTPVKAETIKGKTFKGWKFSKPTTTQLP